MKSPLTSDLAPATGVPPLAAGSAADPVCGHCGRPLSAHYHENEVYCFQDTTGDIYTDEPSDDHMGSFLRYRHAELYAQLVKEWQAENGHAPTTPRPDNPEDLCPNTERPKRTTQGARPGYLCRLVL
jgi:hypothetical protein